jgi:hypothetical protein
MIDYEGLLKEYGLWPMGQWNRFCFNHQSPNGQEEERKMYRQLRCQVSTFKGVYAYKKGRRWLYVGKGKCLFNRLKTHYHAAYKEIPGDTQDNRWHRFFSNEENRGKLTVYWIEIDCEPDRQIFEIALSEVLNPCFTQFR